MATGYYEMLSYRNLFFTEFDLKLLGRIVHSKHASYPAKYAAMQQVSAIKDSRGL